MRLIPQRERVEKKRKSGIILTDITIGVVHMYLLKRGDAQAEISLLEQFEPTDIIGQHATSLETALRNRINGYTNNPYLNGGLLAADLTIVYGDNGFGQWSNEKAVQTAIERVIDSLSTPEKLSVPEIPEWVLGLYSPAMTAGAVLYGRQPSEGELEVVRSPLLKAFDRRAHNADYSEWDVKRRAFGWAYAALQLGQLRVLLGEDDFHRAADRTAEGTGHTTSSHFLNHLLSRTKEHVEQQSSMTKEKSFNDGLAQRVVGNLAALRLISASEVEIIEGEGLRITDDNSEAQIESNESGLVSLLPTA
jgi:hypothetical protein